MRCQNEGRWQRASSGAGSERKADKILPADNTNGTPVPIDSDDAAATAPGRGNIKIAGDIKGEALGPAQAGKERFDGAVGIDAPDRIVGGSGRRGNVEVAVGTEG